MFSMMQIEVADYVLYEDEKRKQMYIALDRIQFYNIYVNPFCVMTISEITDNVSTKETTLGICLITLSDGNKFIVKKKPEDFLRILETHIDGINLPY